jgi:hypothetical protein
MEKIERTISNGLKRADRYERKKSMSNEKRRYRPKDIAGKREEIERKNRTVGTERTELNGRK